jgi:hypothetical protein
LRFLLLVLLQVLLQGVLEALPVLWVRQVHQVLQSLVGFGAWHGVDYWRFVEIQRYSLLVLMLVLVLRPLEECMVGQ